MLSAAVLLQAGTAAATNLEFGVSVPLSGWVGFSELQAGGARWAGAVGSRSVSLASRRSLALPPLGAVTLQSEGRLLWQGGYRLGTQASAALGPVALSLEGALFNRSVDSFDPMTEWNLGTTDLRGQGWTLGADLRYRVRRDLIATVGGQLGGQRLLSLEAEWRRDLLRTLPPAEDADPTDPPDIERTGTLSYRAGVQAGDQLLALSAGVGYSSETGKTFALDAQYGRGQANGLGLVMTVGLPDALGENSNLNLYGAYEPWRLYAHPLRAGLSATKALGRGTAQLKVQGGRTASGDLGYGVSLGYTLPLFTTTEQSEN